MQIKGQSDVELKHKSDINAQNKVSQVEKYELMNRVEEKINITNDLKKTLAAVTQERDDSIKMIMMLKEELRLQEQHYNNTSGT